MEVQELSELDNFTQAFNGFLYSRGCSDEFLQANREYMDKTRFQNELYEKLKAYLPEETENKTPYDILRACNDNNNYLVSLGVQSGYRQGFAEGIKLIISTLMLDW
jgi:hypothetical protein